METVLETKLMFCPLCEKEHLIDLVEDTEYEITVEEQKIIYPAKFYRCNQSHREDNTFSDGEMFNEELKTIKMLRGKDI